MKKLFSCIVCLLVLSGCSYDDGELRDRIDDLDGRLEALEKRAEQMNEQIGQMQTLIDAMSGGVAITDVETTAEGVIITLSDGRKLDIRHGEPGTDAPIVGVDEEGGVYYWTLTTDGVTEWLYDDNHEKIPVAGKDGSAGITPRLGVNSEGYWTVDYGDGPEVLLVDGKPVPATGEDGQPGESLFASVEQTDTAVIFTLSTGQSFTVPKLLGARLAFTETDPVALYWGEEVELSIEAEGIRSALVTAPSGWQARVNLTEGKVWLTGPDMLDERAELTGAVGLVAVTEHDQSVAVSRDAGVTETFPSVKRINEILEELVVPVLDDAAPRELTFTVSETVADYEGLTIPAEFTAVNVPSIEVIYAGGASTTINIGNYSLGYDGRIDVVLPEGQTAAAGAMQVPAGTVTLSGGGVFSNLSTVQCGLCRLETGTTATSLSLTQGPLMVFGTIGTLKANCSQTYDVLAAGRIGSVVDAQNKLNLLRIRKPTRKSSKWISEVVEYRPAPGQFMNVQWGRPEDAQAIVGGKATVGVSLGTFGGSIVFRFDHSIVNTDGVDFVIHGNAFATSNEPGAVQVAFDSNGNGLPDDEWYELAGDSYASADKGYTVTYVRPDDVTTKQPIAWSDNRDGSGEIPTGFYNRTYWPTFLEGETLTYTGNLLTNVTTVSSQQAGMGYVDNYTSDYQEIVGSDADTQSSNKFDLDRAVNAEGKPVKLLAVDFIRVYNPVFDKTPGIFGEISTEVCGAISVHPQAGAGDGAGSSTDAWGPEQEF